VWSGGGFYGVAVGCGEWGVGRGVRGLLLCWWGIWGGSQLDFTAIMLA